MVALEIAPKFYKTGPGKYSGDKFVRANMTLNNTQDLAACGGLSEHLQTIGSALDQYLQFKADGIDDLNEFNRQVYRAIVRKGLCIPSNRPKNYWPMCSNLAIDCMPQPCPKPVIKDSRHILAVACSD